MILGAGPPCQGVSGLNADRLGALKDARSSLFSHVKRIELEVKVCFPWCAVYTLIESVASMDDTDLEAMSSSFGSYPWRIDAGGMLWCSRPRVHWLEWELFMEEGATMVKNNDNGAGEILLEAKQPLETVCREGWTKLVVDRPFPTFTTSRPRAMPGRKPAGVGQCRDHEIERWVSDNYRFPPYQYCDRHCLVNKSGELRLPDIQEKEIMLGFPLNYTSGCMGKSSRKGSDYVDLRHTLIGNTWAVPVVAWLIGQLLWPLGICKKWTTQDLVDHLSPHMCDYLQTRLLRLPLRPLRGASNTMGAQELVNKLGNLVSVKGEDILLVNKTSEQAKYHRLRASVPSKLWVWKIIAGWQWKGQQEHINVLEMRAILASLQWKLHHKQLQRSSFKFILLILWCVYILSVAVVVVQESCEGLYVASTRSCWLVDVKVCGDTSTQTPIRPTVLVDGGGGSRPNLEMVKRILEGQSPAERATKRRQLGTLRQLTVQGPTRARYETALDSFLKFLKTNSQFDLTLYER